MRITEVQIAPKVIGRLRAFAAICIDDTFEMRGFKIVEIGDRLRVSWPRPRVIPTEPIPTALREAVERRVLAAYAEALCLQPTPDGEASVPSPS